MLADGCGSFPTGCPCLWHHSCPLHLPCTLVRSGLNRSSVRPPRGRATNATNRPQPPMRPGAVRSRAHRAGAARSLHGVSGSLCPLSVQWRLGRVVARCRRPRQGFKVAAGTVVDAGRRPGDLLWSLDAQRAATVANLAGVVTWKGGALCPKPPVVLARVRVGTTLTVVRLVAGSSPQTHCDLPSPDQSAEGDLIRSMRVAMVRREFPGSGSRPEGREPPPTSGEAGGGSVVRSGGRNGRSLLLVTSDDSSCRRC